MILGGRRRTAAGEAPHRQPRRASHRHCAGAGAAVAAVDVVVDVAVGVFLSAPRSLERPGWRWTLL